MTFDIYNMVLIMPEIIVLSGACLLILLDLVLDQNQKHIIAYLSLLVILIAAAGTWMFAGNNSGEILGRMFTIDGYSTFFKMVFYLSLLSRTPVHKLYQGGGCGTGGILCPDALCPERHDDHGIGNRPAQHLCRAGTDGPVYLCADRFYPV